MRHTLFNSSHNTYLFVRRETDLKIVDGSNQISVKF